ncbi:alpha/beta hydrolase [Hyphococcus lacteus]|uniref:Alpha/beta hydrolase-fold protein n=1 Tax=Hyphococcus lacteus TaxID=3143536 RepID=A0ABV3Z0B3_9PROT
MPNTDHPQLTCRHTLCNYIFSILNRVLLNYRGAMQVRCFNYRHLFKWLTILLLTFASLSTNASGEPPLSDGKKPSNNITPFTPYVMPRSDVRTIKSDQGAEYRIYIAWPEEPAPPEGYPVLYRLDGTTSFAIAAEYANRLGRYTGMSPGIIVGIGYAGPSRRRLDYTPDVAPGIEFLSNPDPTGGADEFLTFIADSLIPAIENDFPINSNRRSISGYSLGGLFVTQALLKRPELFRTYIASSPSLWWGDRHVFNLIPKFQNRLSKDGHARRLFLTIGQYEQSPPPGMENDPSWQKNAELNALARMNDNASELVEALSSTAGLSVHLEEFPNETHASGSLPAIRASLRHAFADEY